MQHSDNITDKFNCQNRKINSSGDNSLAFMHQRGETFTLFLQA